jgi:cyclic pyranopterin phosphate synthase
MDVGGATGWSMDLVVSQEEILERLRRHYGSIEPVAGKGSAPADRFVLSDGTALGVIASTTRPFCRSCDRSRLTADGRWLLCLYGEAGLDLRDLLRQDRSDAEIAEAVSIAWRAREDRGAEQRTTASERGALYQLASLRADPHREMHTRGG